MNEARARALARVLAVASATPIACSESDPPDCPSAIASARGTYLECVAEIGIEVEHLEITVAGDIDVVFAPSTTAQQAEQAQLECEPLMEEALTLGLVACETTEIGRPASAERIEEQVERAAQSGFSGSIAIVRDGAPLWSGGVGLADRERGIANATTTAFDCGSIMKVMTAAAIFRLEQDGMLSRTATLGELFTEVPPDKAEITLDQILAHRAGFDEFHDTEGDFEPMDRPTALTRILAQELLFPPGTDEAYSSSGYTLLAAVVEDVSGMAFSDYLRVRLFDVAMMPDTGVYGEGLWPDGQAAIGYDDGVYGCNSPGCWPAPSWALVGNGGLVSTVEDLLRWTAAVDEAVVLDAATRDAYRDAVLGTREILIDGQQVYAYSGRNDFGFGAAVGEVPGRDTYVVVASNAAANYNDTALMAQLVQMTLGALIELP